MRHQHPEVLVRQTCVFCASNNTEPLRGKTFCNSCGRLFEVIKAAVWEEIDLEIDDAPYIRKSIYDDLVAKLKRLSEQA